MDLYGNRDLLEQREERREDVLRRELLEDLRERPEISDEELLREIDRKILGRGGYLPLEEKRRLRRTLMDSLRGMDVLQPYLDDDTVTEIMVNGPDNIFVERRGKIERAPVRFAGEDRLLEVIRSVVAPLDRSVNRLQPIADARLADGSRLHVVLPPAAVDAPCVTIRKFGAVPLTMEDLIRGGSLTREAAEYLKAAVRRRESIFISGGTGSGKTTFLNALSAYIPPEERVITIEDSAELSLQEMPNLVRLEARNENASGGREITIRELLRASLRMRPDRIIVGEVRGAEALDMLQAMNTGHEGSLSTGHANSPADMLSRLETMAMMGADLPVAAIRSQIASALRLLVHLARGADGGRRVMRICRVRGVKEGTVWLEDVFCCGEEGLSPVSPL
ncbi:MAG: CpaF family protein [Lachnospiraceae bacterium]|nr:CpaF family protein [Lachnospiraceae bacterium]